MKKVKLLLFKIGSDDRPAGPEDIKKLNKQVKKALKGIKNIRTIVTHHLFELDILPLS